MLSRIVCCVVLCVLSFGAHSVESDKKMHFAVSAGLGFAANSIMDDYRYSMASCMAVGVAKEVYDEIDYGGFSEKDLVADLLGCGVGVVVNEVTDLKFHVSPLRGGYMFNLGMDF